MGKEKSGFLTPKAIANRIKSKGLQKLRWYCQMCQKQCRDENGYKCHTSSEAHHRQMKIFMENGGKFISSFSSEFLKGYLDIVRRQFGGKRVHANVVYQEYIKEKEHIHMNATRWHSLTGLCLWLGKQGICRVDETEKGWFIEYIDRDPEVEKRKATDARLEKTEDEINKQFLEKQIERNLQHTKTHISEEKEFLPLTREDEEKKIRLDLFLGQSMKSKLKESSVHVVGNVSESGGVTSVESVSDTELKQPIVDTPAREKFQLQNLPVIGKKPRLKLETGTLSASGPHKTFPVALPSSSVSSTAVAVPSSSLSSIKPSKSGTALRRTALDEIMDEEERFKEKKNRKDYWLTSGIVVKLINQKLPRELLYRRAVVIDMEDDYTALVKVLKGKTKLKVDQEHVQTVIPPVNDYVLVVNGGYRGEVAIVKRINNDDGLVDIVIDSGLCRGRLVRNVMMEDVCEVHDEKMS